LGLAGLGNFETSIPMIEMTTSPISDELCVFAFLEGWKDENLKLASTMAS
jgi:hypothetical protein